MSESVNIQEILELIPHRYPFLLLDKVNDYKANEYLIGQKNVTMNEPFFKGHFPGNPIMPGVLILEALAQAGAVLSSLSREPGEGMSFLYFFAGIDNARFKQVVSPGDVLELQITVLKQKSTVWKVHGKALVDGELACSADLLSASKEVPRD